MPLSNSTLAPPARLPILLRSAAYLADILILFAVLFPLGWAVVLAVGFSPASGIQVWQATLINFSIPAWLYFTLSDSLWGGKTLGKRLLRLKVARTSGQPLSVPRAFLRTSVKLLPWELAHIGGFALQAAPAWQWAAIGLSNLLVVVYLAAAIATRGRRSVHDWVVRTEVSDDLALRSRQNRA